MTSASTTKNRVINRAADLERAARARATVTAYLGSITTPYATIEELGKACQDIKGVNLGNVLYRMAQNKLITLIPISGKGNRKGYRLANAEAPTPAEPEASLQGAGGAASAALPAGPVASIRRKRRSKDEIEADRATYTDGKPTVIVSKSQVVVDFAKLRVIVRIEDL